jgi:hypothetical protein
MVPRHDVCSDWSWCRQVILDEYSWDLLADQYVLGRFLCYYLLVLCTRVVASLLQ